MTAGPAILPIALVAALAALGPGAASSQAVEPKPPSVSPHALADSPSTPPAPTGPQVGVAPARPDSARPHVGDRPVPSAPAASHAVIAPVPPAPAGPPTAGPPAPPDATGPPTPGSPLAPVVEPRRPGIALFYFFSPDWRPPDFSKLTFAVEQALAGGGVHVSFQAFTRYEDFERQVRAQPPTFMIAPAWLEAPDEAPIGASFRVIARPLRHGRTSYRKALMTRSNADSIDDLARGSIAATLHSMGSGDPDAVLGSFHLGSGSARIVPVPKDIDALLALSFGQVDAALVTSEQYEQLARTSPVEAERLRVLAFSSEVGLPPVFAAASAEAAERERLTALLARIREVPNGGDLLAMLGFDAFESEQSLAARREAEADQAAANEASTAAAAAAVANAQTAAEQSKSSGAKTGAAKTGGKSKPVAKPARPAKKTGSAGAARRG